jgi:uncharacterized protein (DUF1684 family)
MKKNYKVFSMLFLMSIFVLNTYGQEYDCQVENDQYRNNKNSWIIQDVNKPFNAAEIVDFTGLFYYPVDCKYVFTGTVAPAGLKVVNVGTTKGGTVQLYEFGIISCKIGGETYQLMAYKNIDLPEFGRSPDTYFIPFKDKTSGPEPKTTYANGRYLIIEPPANGNQVILDFNMATNPYENYNSKYSTLLVPDQNVIMAPIATGERKYEDR